MAQIKAAQQILQANKAAAGQQMSPEQQMVQLEQARVVLEQQKLQLKAATDSADAALENRKLDLEEKELEVKIIQKGMSQQLDMQDKNEDRSSRQAIKAIDILTRVATEQAKLETSEKLKVMEVVAKLAAMANDDNRDRQLKGMEMLMELAKMAEETDVQKENLSTKVKEIISEKEIDL